MKSYSGYTSKTPEHLILDAGAFFKNFDVEEDTFETAVTSGKLLGATRGGGEFSAVPAIRRIEVDGVKGRAKGLERLDEWDVYIKATVLEVTEDTIKEALCAVETDEETVPGYTVIRGKNAIELADYIDNITWVGTLSGSNKPVIIKVLNVINTDGLKLTTQDKNEGTVAMTFYGHYADNLDEPPFEIYYPKANEAAQVNNEPEGDEQE